MSMRTRAIFASSIHENEEDVLKTHRTRAYLRKIVYFDVIMCEDVVTYT